ncbi:ABC transporter substrate-binding protein [Pseudodesulfovibrio nedwellii]|nr:ABC transporter substrate-binding protein [Pseudodesulfovibrio nedwellii]
MTLIWRCAMTLLLLAWMAFPCVPARADTSRELTFGMSAAFTGANGELGIEFYRGFMAYIDHFNAVGGANGWTIKVIPANDGYNPAPCFQNTIRFIDHDDVFALFSYVGTPTTTHILPLLQKFEDRNIFLLFPFTGAQPLRTEPFGKYVYNLRASYFDETRGLVDRLVAIGRKRIGVFYQSDAYGRTGWDGVHRALERHGLLLSGEAAYRRGASFSQDFSSEVALLMESDPEAIIVVGTYASQAAFIRDARNAGYKAPIAGLSFADSDKMLELLMTEGNRVHRDYTKNLINSQVVPSYTDLSLPGVRLYRKIMDGYHYEPVAQNDDYTPRKFSYVSFEGFLNGVVLGEMITRMSDDPMKTRIPEVLASIKDFDLGIGVKADFSRNGHQGLDAVYFTTVIDGLFQAVENWEQWR